MPVVAQVQRRRLLACHDGRGDANFDVYQPGNAISRKQRLEGIMTFPPERPAISVCILKRVRRIEMGAGNVTRWQRLGGGVGSTAAQQLRQNVGMRAIGTLPVRRRYRLKDLNAPDPADENPVQIGRKNHPHGPVSGGKDRPPHAVAERGNDLRVGATDAGIDLQGAQAEIEENGGAIVCTQRIGVGPTSVRTLRALMAQAGSGRHSATRWFQVLGVSDSEAIARRSGLV
jgi:hypothetical protein